VFSGNADKKYVCERQNFPGIKCASIFPAKFINTKCKCSTKTVGIHPASGARMFANEYSAHSLAWMIAWDQASLTNFDKLAKLRGFDYDNIPELKDHIISNCRFRSLVFQGIDYTQIDEA